MQAHKGEEKESNDTHIGRRSACVLTEKTKKSECPFLI